jgi:hypothetical protein
LQLAKDLAAVIAFVTAIVAFVKLLLSGWSSVGVVLPWAGVAYLGVAEALILYLLVKPGELQGDSVWTARLGGAIAVVMIPLTVIAALLSGDKFLLGSIAVFGLLGGLVNAGQYYRKLQRDRAASSKVCPECAEDVKAAARKCRHCGYRFPVDADATA